MYSYAVRNNIAQLLMALVVLILCGAAEDLLPKICGVGFPCLLTAAIWGAVNRKPLGAAIFALAAGSMEDALSVLPFASSAGFFILAAVITRLLRLRIIFTVLFYAIYQLWLWLWIGALDGGIFMRLCLAIPIALVTVVVEAAFLKYLARKAALNEKRR